MLFGFENLTIETTLRSVLLTNHPIYSSESEQTIEIPIRFIVPLINALKSIHHKFKGEFKEVKDLNELGEL